MNIFLLEYITGGGVNTHDLPQSLLPEALAMRDALLADFYACGAEIVTTFDARLNAPNFAQNALAISANMQAKDVWQQCLQTCDAALIVAPETDHILAQMTTLIESTEVMNLGSGSAAVNVASNKYKSFLHLQAQHILTVPTYLATDIANIESLINNQALVIKPIDGAGCEDTWLFVDLQAAEAWITQSTRDWSRYIVQPYIIGVAASFTMLCKNGHARVLSCNSQTIHAQRLSENVSQLHYQGGVVNAMHAFYPQFYAVASQIAASMLDLNGMVGVDVIVQASTLDEAAVIYVVDINPRVTTAYVGLHASISQNPAQLLLNTMHTNDINLEYVKSPLTIKIQLHG